MNPVKKDQKWSEMSGGQRVGVAIAAVVVALVVIWIAAVVVGLAVKVLAAVWS